MGRECASDRKKAANKWLAQHDAELRERALAPVKKLIREHGVDPEIGTFNQFQEGIWPSDILNAITRDRSGK